MRYTVLLLLVALFACKTKPIPSNTNHSENKPIDLTKRKDVLLGTWVYQTSEKNSNTFVKVSTFQSDKPGIAFKADGTLIKRQNAGWCGTPPISYKNEEGTWEATSPNTLNIAYNYWGGKQFESIKIIELKKDTLRLEIIETKSLKTNKPIEPITE